MIFNDTVGVHGNTQSFGLCGVRVHKKVATTIVLDQASCVYSGINPINVNIHHDLDRPLTAGEITSLRGVWRAMQWRVTQTGPQHAAALSEMKSSPSQPPLGLIKETIRLVSDVELNDTLLTIHPFSRQLKWNDLLTVTHWLDDEQSQACGEEFTECRDPASFICLQLGYSGVKSWMSSDEAKRHRCLESNTWKHCLQREQGCTMHYTTAVRQLWT